MRYLLLSLTFCSFFLTPIVVHSEEKAYQNIEFSSEKVFFKSLGEALSEDLNTNDVKEALKVFQENKKTHKNYTDSKSLIEAQPTSAKTIVSNVKRLKLGENKSALNDLQSRVYSIAKVNFEKSSSAKIPIAAAAVIPALAVFSNSGSSLPTLSIDDVTTSNEVAGNATFTVTLSEVSENTITVNYLTSNGTATAGSDYTAIASTTLTFAPGDMSQEFTVAVLSDSLDEANETVTLTLSGAENATISDATGTLTIADDDVAPSLSIDDVTKAEVVGSSTTATFTVTLSAASGQTVTVSYATSNGTATAGSDYTAVSATTLTFSAGQTSKTFNVTVLADTSYEISETATLTLSSASNATISDATGTLTITDKALNSGYAPLTSSQETTANNYKATTEFSNINTNPWGSGYASYYSTTNEFELINVHKAWAYGLTGAGTTVLVSDSNFDTDSNSLDGVSGKVTTYGTITECSNTADSCHGAAVSGLIAADRGDSGPVGVAPGTKLVLTSSNIATLTAAYSSTNASTAVAANHSWGFNDSLIDDEISLKISNSWSSNELVANRFYGSTSSVYVTAVDNWITAMDDFQDHGVIVFSNSNTSSNDNAEITAALPEIFPELEEAFIAAVNIDVGGSTNYGVAGATGYRRWSAPCGDAARYCLAADGSIINTLNSNNRWTYGIYDTNNNGAPDSIHAGTSFVAPMISGAVAIMAEAFPNMSPGNWRDRLLASANNKIGYPELGRRTFGNGVVHGYSHEAGHGLLDIYAALQPITSTSYAQIMYAGADNNLGQSFTLNSTKLSGSQSFGDALTNALKDEKTYFYDALDGGFEFSLDQMVKDSKSVNINGVKLAHNNIKSVRDEWKNKEQANGHEQQALKNNYFDSSVNTQSKALTEFFDSGNTYTFGSDTYFLPFMTNVQGGSGANLGLKMRDDKGFLTLSSVKTPSSNNMLGNQNAIVGTYEHSLQRFGSYGLMIGNVNEGSSFLGTSGAGAFNLDNSKSKTNVMNVKLNLNVSPNSNLGLMSGISKSSLNKGAEGVITGIDDVISDSFALSYNVLAENKVEKFSFSLSQPHRIRSGSMAVQIAGLTDKKGNISYEYKSLGLNPSGRQLDLSLGYTRDLSKKMTISTHFTVTRDAGHEKSLRPNGSVYLGLINKNIFGNDIINLGAVVSDRSGETNAKVNYSINW